MSVQTDGKSEAHSEAKKLLSIFQTAVTRRMDSSGHAANHDVVGEGESLASQSIPSWNQIIVWLKEMESLRNCGLKCRI